MVPQFLSRPRPHVGTEPKVEISQMNHPQGTVCCSKVIKCPYYTLPFPGTQRVGVSIDWCIRRYCCLHLDFFLLSRYVWCSYITTNGLSQYQTKINNSFLIRSGILKEFYTLEE